MDWFFEAVDTEYDIIFKKEKNFEKTKNFGKN